MATYKRTTGYMRDKGVRLEFDGKDVRGLNGAELYTRAPQVFEHFIDQRATAVSPWTESKVNTGAAAFLTNGIGGVLQIVTSGASGDALAEVLKGAIMIPSKNALTRPISFEARVKVPTITTVELSFGLSDQTGLSGIAYTSSAASAITTSAPSDAAAFFFSTVATSGTFFTSGGNAVSGITSIAGTDTGFTTAKVFDTSYHIYRVEVDVNGAAYFYYDDKLVKFVNGAVTATALLSPFFSVVTRTAATREIDVDYIQFAGDLATTTT